MKTLYQYIKNTSLTELIADGRKKRKDYYRSGYAEYKDLYALYFRSKNDYMHLIWNLYLKAMLEKPFYKAFRNKMPPASYPFGITFNQGIQNVKKNVEAFFSIPWEDEKSKYYMKKLIRYRLTGNKNDLFEKDYSKEIYFDEDIIHLTNQEIFVDCGGYIGDTTLKFVNEVKSYNKIYIYEPDKNNFLKATHSLKKYPNVILRNCAVGKQEQESFARGKGAGFHLKGDEHIERKEGRENTISVKYMDKDIMEKITFLKMDIEGYELDALKGARNHIKNDSPVLAISVYHKLSDIYEIPRYILSINNGYKIYLRHYGNTIGDFVLYAIPEHRI